MAPAGSRTPRGERRGDAPAPRELPGRVHLPSGAVVRLSDRAAREAAAELARAGEDGGAPRDRGGWMAQHRVLSTAGVVRSDDGGALDVGALALRDAHVLRALLLHARVLPEAVAEYDCENCGAGLAASPSSLLEIAPFVDGELDDPDLDAPFDFDRDWPLSAPRPARAAGAAPAWTVRLAPRTLAEALPLWRAAGKRLLRITPAVVAAMGITALGKERKATAISDALARAPSRLWSELADRWNQAHYPARLVAVLRCEECGARNDLDVPAERELCREAPPGGGGGKRGPFPDLDAFEARVRAIAAEVYRARAVRNIDLFIDAGVAACDDGGEPLLGCYTPGSSGADAGIAEPPEIRLFYRTFAAEHSRDPGFDVEREIRETIDHEIGHHLNHMGGVDPLDEEEREEIRREEERLVGKAEVVRRARRGLASDLAGFWRATWPVWVVALAGTALAFCADG